MHSAKAVLQSRRRLSGSLQPRIGACNLCCRSNDKNKKKEGRSSLYRWHRPYDYVLLLPHFGCGNWTRSRVVGVVRCHLGCDRKVD
jgi:hypothetical protein